jgi:hypothetical protein
MGEVRRLRALEPTSGQKVTITLFFEELPRDIGPFNDECERLAKQFGALERPLLTIVTIELADDAEYQFVRRAGAT